MFVDLPGVEPHWTIWPKKLIGHSVEPYWTIGPNKIGKSKLTKAQAIIPSPSKGAIHCSCVANVSCGPGSFQQKTFGQTAKLIKRQTGLRHIWLTFICLDWRDLVFHKRYIGPYTNPVTRVSDSLPPHIMFMTAVTVMPYPPSLDKHKRVGFLKVSFVVIINVLTVCSHEAHRGLSVTNGVSVVTHTRFGYKVILFWWPSSLNVGIIVIDCFTLR